MIPFPFPFMSLGGLLVALALGAVLYFTVLHRFRRSENFAQGKPRKITLFYADPCVQCRKFKPVWAKYVAANKDNDLVEMTAVDCEQDQELAEEYEIQFIPAVIVEQDGKVVKRYDGTPDKSLEKYFN